MCSGWQVYLLGVGGSPIALSNMTRRIEKLQSPRARLCLPASERFIGGGMCGIQLYVSVWGLGHKIPMSCEGRCPDLKRCQCFVWSPVMLISSNRDDNHIKRMVVSGPTNRWSLRVSWSCEITGARYYFKCWLGGSLSNMSLYCLSKCQFCVDDGFASCVISGINLYQVKFKFCYIKNCLIVSKLLFFFNWLTSSEREYSNQHHLICLWRRENWEQFSLFFILVQNFEIQNRVNKDLNHRSSSSRNTKVVRIDQIVKPNITISVLVMVSFFLIPDI